MFHVERNIIFMSIEKIKANIRDVPDFPHPGIMPGKWIFTPSKTSWIPFLTYSTRRDLREKLYKGYWMRGDYGNATDNKQVILDIMASGSRPYN